MSASLPASVMTAPPVEPSRTRGIVLHREVLLATDGSPAAQAASRIAAALGARWAVSPSVCTVPPSPSMAFDSSPAAEIVRVAEQRGSDLIVLGLRPHAFLDRVFRDETALTVMRNAMVPVLAVTPLLTRLPRRVAVAIDFSRASIAAARAALPLIDDGGSLMLVYVEPEAEPRTPGAEGYATIFAQGVAGAFGRLRQELSSRTDVRIETMILHGAVVPELLSFAERADVDLLGVGSQRHSVTRRAVVGSVTTALARAATHSLLVIPPGRQA
jgi:nucleotide-binding universal stress UspA family protein